MCGITTGGNENCEWDCISGTLYAFENSIYSNIECLRDCFSDEDHCVSKVLNDFENAGGICGESYFGSLQNTFPTAENECKYTEVVNEQNIAISYTTEGIFSEDTLISLNTDECIFDVHRKSPLIYNTIQLLVVSSSNIQTFKFWITFSLKHVGGLSDVDINTIYPLPSNTETKLNPGIR